MWAVLCIRSETLSSPFWRLAGTGVPSGTGSYLLIDDGASHFPDVGQTELPGGVLQQQHRLPAEADLEMEGDAGAPRLRRAGRPDNRRSAHRQLPTARSAQGGVVGGRARGGWEGGERNRERRRQSGGVCKNRRRCCCCCSVCPAKLVAAKSSWQRGGRGRRRRGKPGRRGQPRWRWWW